MRESVEKTMQLDLFAAEIDEEIHQVFIKDLKLGSGFVGGKKRIINFFKQGLTKEETIDRLKGEYGVGARGYDAYFQSHDGKGIEITVKGTTKLYTWNQVYDAIFNLIKSGEYFREFEDEK